MIKFNDRFTAERDKYQWILKEHYMGKAVKDKPAKMQCKESYYGTLRQVCNAVIDRSAGDCESLGEVITMLDECGWVLEGKASGLTEKPFARLA